MNMMSIFKKFFLSPKITSKVRVKIEDEYDVDFQEILSESEDNLESQSEEDSDELPDESNTEEFHYTQYVAKSDLKWNSLPFRSSKTPLRNLVNALPGRTRRFTVVVFQVE
ncbi:hypothetical protein QE152_g23426 [Popillia japonica]|uniref:Uncharacterized protein n=1 Tax=Popillia japonica TaxID=7064 RepID=A0AAW1KGY9_POPJA